MQMYLKTIIISLIVATIVTVVGLGVIGNNQSGSMLAGGTTNLDRLDLTEGLTLGSNGTTLTRFFSGTCSLVSDASIAATSTGTGTCAATGVTASDKVFVDLATTTTKMSAQYAVVGTVAGTDTITVRLLNLTGAAAVPSATNGLGSSTQYWVTR